MSKDTIVILVVTGLLLFVWLPALFFSVRRVMRQDKIRQARPDRASQPNQ